MFGSNTTTNVNNVSGPTRSHSSRKCPLELPRSAALLLQYRSQGCFGDTLDRRFVAAVTRPMAQKSLLPHLEISGTAASSACQQRGIASIAVDPVEQRFLITGGDDATVSVYDLSKWGSDRHQATNGHRRQRNKEPFSESSSLLSTTRFHPIARSTRQAPQPQAAYETPAVCSIPTGHAAGITRVQWYPVDSGAFVSTSKDGRLLVWDTEQMTPVASSKPFVGIGGLNNNNTNNNLKPIDVFDISPQQPDCVAVASRQDATLKLVDLRSSASSHSLLAAHAQGITACIWAPHHDYIVASGGMEGRICLWDIRKPGSRACICQLNQEVTRPCTTISASFRSDYSHLPKPGMGSTKQTVLAPNNYRSTQGTFETAHDGPVAALAFTASSHFLISAGTDAIRIWDLRGNGHCLPRIFLPPTTGSIVSLKQSSHHVPLVVTHETMSSMGECWVAGGPAGNSIYQYPLERGGRPQQVLQGHLQTITALEYIHASKQLLSAGNDGMILAWGKQHYHRNGGGQRKRKVDSDVW